MTKPVKNFEVMNAASNLENLVTRLAFEAWRSDGTFDSYWSKCTLDIHKYRIFLEDTFTGFALSSPEVMHSVEHYLIIAKNTLCFKKHDYTKNDISIPANLFATYRTKGTPLTGTYECFLEELDRAHNAYLKYTNNNTTDTTDTEETQTMFGKNQIESRADKAMSSFEDYLPEITAENIAKGVASDVLESFLKKSEMDGDQYQTHLHNLASSSEENKSRVWKFIAAHVQAVLEGKAVGSTNYFGAMDPSYMELVKASHDYSVAHSRPEQRVITAMKAEWDDLQHAIYRAYLDDSMVENFYDFNQLGCSMLVKESKYFQMLNVIGQYLEIHKDDIETAMKVMVDLLKKDMENNE